VRPVHLVHRYQRTKLKQKIDFFLQTRRRKFRRNRRNVERRSAAQRAVQNGLTCYDATCVGGVGVGDDVVANDGFKVCWHARSNVLSRLAATSKINTLSLATCPAPLPLSLRCLTLRPNLHKHFLSLSLTLLFVQKPYFGFNWFSVSLLKWCWSNLWPNYTSTWLQHHKTAVTSLTRFHDIIRKKIKLEI